MAKMEEQKEMDIGDGEMTNGAAAVTNGHSQVPAEFVEQVKMLLGSHLENWLEVENDPGLIIARISVA